MKIKNSFAFRLWLGLWLGLALSPAPAQTKRALLITIARYAPGSGWGQLSSDRDGELMTQTLRRQGITRLAHLRNEAATLAGIRKALDTLLSEARPGDNLILHYAGHGHQVLDRNGDEPDGLDEALVPYDAPRRADYARYRGERHLLDDEIGSWVLRLRRKVGPSGQVWLLLDCCHAGTGARAGATRAVRGGAPPIAPADFQFPETRSESETAADQSVGATRGSGPLAPFVLMAGALASQLNYEVTDEAGQSHGALTYAVAEAFTRLRAGDSYQRLFNTVTQCLAEKAPHQSPALEGDTAAPVLGGDVVSTPGWFDVVRQTGTNLTRTVRVVAGWLTGLFAESRLGFVPPNHSRGHAEGSGPSHGRSAAAVVVRGRVTSAGLLESVVELDRPLPASAASALRAYETEKAFGETALLVGLDVSLPDDFLISVKKALAESLDLRLVEAGRASHLIRRENSVLFLTETATFRTLDSLPLAHPDPAGHFANRLHDEYLARLVRGLHLEHPQLRGTLGLLGDSLRGDAAGYPTFRTGTRLRLRLVNTGSLPCYAAVLDVQPDGVLHTLLPNPDRGYAEVYLRPGEAREISLRLTPPYGAEVYKALFSSHFLDPRSAIQTRGNAPASPSQHPFLGLLRRGFRGEPPAPLPTDGLGTATYAFRIVP